MRHNARVRLLPSRRREPISAAPKTTVLSASPNPPTRRDRASCGPVGRARLLPSRAVEKSFAGAGSAGASPSLVARRWGGRETAPQQGEDRSSQQGEDRSSSCGAWRQHVGFVHRALPPLMPKRNAASDPAAAQLEPSALLEPAPLGVTHSVQRGALPVAKSYCWAGSRDLTRHGAVL